MQGSSLSSGSIFLLCLDFFLLVAVLAFFTGTGAAAAAAESFVLFLEFNIKSSSEELSFSSDSKNLRMRPHLTYVYRKS